MQSHFEMLRFASLVKEYTPITVEPGSWLLCSYIPATGPYP